jgi:hypothetical protein
VVTACLGAQGALRPVRSCQINRPCSLRPHSVTGLTRDEMNRDIALRQDSEQKLGRDPEEGCVGNGVKQVVWSDQCWKDNLLAKIETL